MIDEKKLIEDLEKRSCALGYDVIDYVEWLINKQPKVGEWIPCSERLPSEDGMYLVCSSNLRVENPRIFKYHKGEVLSWENELGIRITVGKVISWMPLPAPYNAERGGKND